jgi:alpha-1,6-mannosyltransferase
MTGSTELGSPARGPGVFTRAPGWVVLGLAGSVLITVTGARLGGGTVSWWFRPRILSGSDANRALFYIGMAGLAIAWLGLWRMANARSCRPAQLAAVAALWCLPLAIGAPLFSRDLYSYLAQGTVAHLGLSPYHDAPAVLARLGHQHVLAAVDPFWRNTTAPYGPLFLGVISLIVGVTGSHLVVGALLVRGFDLIGLVLLAVFIPRLARRTGADPTRAMWLAVASPLVLLQLVAPAHNDLLMAGVMLAGVTLAVERRPLLGVVVCALAATIKLPALAAVLFIAVAWIRSQAEWQVRLLSAARAVLAALGTAAAVTLVTGFGIGWISTALFSTPARVRIAITPATDISWTAAKLLNDLGATVNFHGLESVLRPVTLAVSVIIGLALLRRCRWETLPHYLGLTLIVFAVGGPALWPWYLSWGLVLLAADGTQLQASRLVVVGILAGSFLVKPGGMLLLSRGSSPIVVCVWAALGVILWQMSRRRARRSSSAEVSGGEPGTPSSALADPVAR